MVSDAIARLGCPIIAILFAKLTANPVVSPEVAVSAVLWLIFGKTISVQRRYLQSFRFSPKFRA